METYQHLEIYIFKNYGTLVIKVGARERAKVGGEIGFVYSRVNYLKTSDIVGKFIALA